jgi:sigma-B regulation protein RsbU (phosphoserine phosphatase)
MKLEGVDKKALLKPALAGAALVIVAVLTLEGTAILQYAFSKKGLKEEASLRAESQLEATRNQILDVIDQAETAVRNNIWLARWCLEVPDSLHRVAERIVEDNPVIVGSTVALIPGYSRKLPLYAPYALREGDGVVIKSLAVEDYDYPSQEWFTKPVETGQGYWSEPYIDEGGGEILMTTYSVPIRDKKGNIAAVLTADLSLDWLTELVGNVKVYPNAFSIMLSRTGQFMVCPAETLVMHRTINEFVGGLEGNNRDIDSLAKAMMSGKEGNMPIRYKGATSYIYFSPVERTGWSMSIVIPDTEIYGGVRRIGLWVKILQILGILLIILIIYSVFKSSLKYRAMNASREKMESELQIASAIQMAMIPKIFPPFPERKDLDMAAAIVPAKEVG